LLSVIHDQKSSGVFPSPRSFFGLNPVRFAEKGSTMPETDLYKPSRQQYQQDNEPIEPDWRDALSRAVKRNSLDREREKFQDGERRQNPQRNPQQH
jgi:hypothetical protein